MSFRDLSGARTPRSSSVRSGGSTSNQAPFALSARHLLKPEVGIAASISAMGAMPPPWSKGRPVLGANGKPEPVFVHADGKTPYNVGRTRARAQLKLALTTEEETSQLRRLREALDSNRFDRCLARELETAESQAKELSRRLGYEEPDELPLFEETTEPAPKKKSKAKAKDEQAVPQGQAKPVEEAPAPSPDEDAFDAALLAEDPEEAAAQEAAACRIQAIQRGKQDRRAVAEKRAAM